jgi:hypothetical protein
MLARLARQRDRPVGHAGRSHADDLVVTDPAVIELDRCQAGRDGDGLTKDRRQGQQIGSNELVELHRAGRQQVVESKWIDDHDEESETRRKSNGICDKRAEHMPLHQAHRRTTNSSTTPTSLQLLAGRA